VNGDADALHGPRQWRYCSPPALFTGETVAMAHQSVAVSRVSTLANTAATEMKHLLVIRPVVRPIDLQMLAALSEAVELTVVVDHFRHAELLSAAVVAARGRAAVLLDVDAGQQATGVRPGPDSERLAAAAARLPGLIVAGVFLDDRSPLDGVERHSSSVDPMRGLTMARAAVESIRHAGVRLVMAVILSWHDVHRGEDNEREIPWLLKPATSHGPDKRPFRRDRGRTATVVSRPALERCVIDAGTCDFGSGATGLRIERPAGATVIAVHEDIAVLGLAGASRDLTIGDEVEFVTIS
jgi:D-serine deaminase-like pyridoxal phosphate-dependent protein